MKHPKHNELEFTFYPCSEILVTERYIKSSSPCSRQKCKSQQLAEHKVRNITITIPKLSFLVLFETRCNARVPRTRFRKQRRLTRSLRPTPLPLTLKVRFQIQNPLTCSQNGRFHKKLMHPKAVMVTSHWTLKVVGNL